MNLFLRLNRRLQRDRARWFCRRPCAVRLKSPIISFTFDDFPKSALLNGGRILRAHGLLGTYYTSFGLMGKTALTGEIFSREDLEEFARQGHELGCHTFDHCHSWDTLPEKFEASIWRNQKAAVEWRTGMYMTSFSYPISHPRPQTKLLTAKHYSTARGGGQTFNAGITDLNYLKAFFLEQSRDDFDAIKRTIDANKDANGWLIFATHDVTDSPTRFGCVPELFQNVVEYAAKSGANILPVRDAYQHLTSDF